MPSGKIKLSIDNNSLKWRQRKLRGYLCSRFTNQKKKKRKTDQKSWENCICTKRVDKGSNVLRNPEKIIFRSRMAHVAGCLDCCGILSVLMEVKIYISYFVQRPMDKQCSKETVKSAQNNCFNECTTAHDRFIQTSLKCTTFVNKNAWR